MFGRPAEHSSPKGRMFSRLQKDSQFHLQNCANESTLLTLLSLLTYLRLLYPLLLSTRLVFVFFNGNLVFARMNLKPAVLKNFLIDWELCFRL